jgi:hypothetical protein
MAEVVCPKHFQKFSVCGCAIPSAPEPPRLEDVCPWCIGSTFGNSHCKSLGHFAMKWGQYRSQHAFWRRTYGQSKAVTAAPKESKEMQTAEIRLPEGMAEYFSALGRRGGSSRSEAKVAAGRANIKRTRTHK